jgi:dienelactone hydrolase
LSDRLPEVLDLANHLKNIGYKSVSILGYCWGENLAVSLPSETDGIGGKISLLALSSELASTPFCCGAIVHPAQMTGEDGRHLIKPLALYPSKVCLLVGSVDLADSAG